MRAPRRRRPIQVASVSHRPSAGVDTDDGARRLMDEASRLIRRAARMGADLIAFPEAYPQRSAPDPFHFAEPAAGGTLDAVRELAREHRLHIVWPRVECDNERGLRNTSILVDRGGEVVGRYDKMFPTVSEMGKGVIPGTAVPTFETDFGRVGLLICFDLNFPEVREPLARAGCDLIVFSSMYRGGIQAQHLAFETGAFVVTSITDEQGRVINRCGRVLAESTYETLAFASINTNSVALHMDFNWDKMDAMLEKYPRQLRFDYHTREAYYVVESIGERDVSEIVEEFGLESARAYFDRTRARRAEALERWESRPA